MKTKWKTCPPKADKFFILFSEGTFGEKHLVSLHKEPLLFGSSVLFVEGEKSSFFTFHFKRACGGRKLFNFLPLQNSPMSLLF
ncbi:MAG: hypothetical protein AAF599_07745 [Bacteroidota bacterium]